MVTWVRQSLKSFRFNVLPVPGRLLAVVFFIFLILIPLTTDSPYVLRLATQAAIYCIFAVSWDVLSGYSGQVSFGHALFLGGGAYGTALLYKHLGLPAAATIPLGALIGTAFGVVTCFPALRLRPPYLSLLTMAFPIIVEQVVRALPAQWAGGDHGIRKLLPLASSPTHVYYICLVVMTISVLIMWKLTDAGSRYVRTGLIFHAIREDEIAARATGINTIRYKILAFAVSGFFAALAGTLLAHYETLASPAYFSSSYSFRCIIFVIFGGIVSIYGGVAGVYTLHAGLDFIRKTPVAPHRDLILAVVVVVVLLFMPEGVGVWIRDKIERECPRCKLRNAPWRRECRACSASLR